MSRFGFIVVMFLRLPKFSQLQLTHRPIFVHCTLSVLPNMTYNSCRNHFFTVFMATLARV